MVCPNCGYELLEEQAVCPECGYDFAQSEACATEELEACPIATAEAAPTHLSKRAKDNHLSTISCILAFFSPLAAIIVGIFAWLYNRKHGSGDKRLAVTFIVSFVQVLISMLFLKRVVGPTYLSLNFPFAHSLVYIFTVLPF